MAIMNDFDVEKEICIGVKLRFEASATPDGLGITLRADEAGFQQALNELAEWTAKHRKYVSSLEIKDKR